MEKKLISIVTACFNEEENVTELYQKVKDVIETHLTEYEYEHIFIDNSSVDDTVKLLKGIASKDNNVKIIVNSRNFGHIRSPVYGMMQASGKLISAVAVVLFFPKSMLCDEFSL